MEVGIGAGSHHFARHDHRVTGIPFPPYAERMARVEACCRILPALWRGENVIDEAMGLTGASLGPVGVVPPPILMGGTSDRALDIAARYADGWHAPGMGPDQFADVTRRLDRACEDLGRQPLRKSTQLRLDDLPHAREWVERFAEAGASTVVFVLDAEQDRDWVGRLADAVL